MFSALAWAQAPTPAPKDDTPVVDDSRVDERTRKEANRWKLRILEQADTPRRQRTPTPAVAKPAPPARAVVAVPASRAAVKSPASAALVQPTAAVESPASSPVATGDPAASETPVTAPAAAVPVQAGMAASAAAAAPLVDAGAPRPPAAPLGDPAPAANEADVATPATTRPVDEAPVPLQLLRRIDPDLRFAGGNAPNGRVTVRLEVGPDGSVAQAELVSSSSSRLNVPVLRAVRQWRFAPVARATTAVFDLVVDPN